MKRRRFKLKRALLFLLAPVLLVLLWWGLDAVVEWRTREALKLFEPYYQVSFDDASIQLKSVNYALTGFRLVKVSAGGDAEPYVSVDRIEVGLYGAQLRKWQWLLAMKLQGLRVNLIAAQNPADAQLNIDVPNFAEKALAAMPLPVDRMALRSAEVTFIDKRKSRFPTLWLHAMDGTFENLAVERARTRGEPTSVALSGKVQKTGELSAFVAADPLAEGLSLSGRAMLRHLELNEISGFLASETGLSVERGTADVFMEFSSRDGRLDGAIKPILRDVHGVQGKDGFGSALKASAAGAAVVVLSDSSAEQATLATVIPLRGTLEAPEFKLWPAIGGMLRNAFLEPTPEGFQGMAVHRGQKDPLASPAELLVPGAPEMIQQALTREGYSLSTGITGKIDGATSEALRKFQSDKNLAKTGAPDHETVRKLKLPTRDAFRSADGGSGR